MGVVMLSDTELRSELLRLGVNVGPITGATRSVYLKKLNKLQAANKTPQAANRTPSNGYEMVGICALCGCFICVFYVYAGHFDTHVSSIY